MDHLRFKTRQTAALYVANGLDERTQEAFELHLLTCPECVEDVETWRALQSELRRGSGKPAHPLAPPAPPPASLAARSPGGLRWQAAASFAAVALVGSAAGWYVRSLQGPEIHDERTAFFNLPPVMRGAEECAQLRFGPATWLVAVRVPGAEPDQQLVLTDLDGREIDTDQYSVVMQADQSWLVRFSADTVRESGMRLMTRGADGVTEPRGCITWTLPD